MKSSWKLVCRIVVFAAMMATTTAVVFAWDSQLPTNITPTAPKPGWDGTNWSLSASAGTSVGEAVCVEFAVDPNGGSPFDATNYTRVEGVYGGDLGGGKHRWNFSFTPTSVYKNVTAPAAVIYQFYVDEDSADCQPGGGGMSGSYTNFSWSFNTSPNAVSLSSFAARQSADGLVLAAAALIGLSGLAVSMVWRRR